MKMRKGFTLIEMMITVAIVGVLAAVAIPAFKVYVGTSHGSSAMKFVSPVARKMQVCIQAGVSCAELNALDIAEAGLSFTPAAARDVATDIVFDNGMCSVTASLTADGGLDYSAIATDVSITDPQCIAGAGL